MVAHPNIDSLIFLFHMRLKVLWWPFLCGADGEANWSQSVSKCHSCSENGLAVYKIY